MQIVPESAVIADNGETIIVLSDDALQDNGQQMQEVAHSAWNASQGTSN